MTCGGRCQKAVLLGEFTSVRGWQLAAITAWPLSSP